MEYSELIEYYVHIATRNSRFKGVVKDGELCVNRRTYSISEVRHLHLHLPFHITRFQNYDGYIRLQTGETISIQAKSKGLIKLRLYYSFSGVIYFHTDTAQLLSCDVTTIEELTIQRRFNNNINKLKMQIELFLLSSLQERVANKKIPSFTGFTVENSLDDFSGICRWDVKVNFERYFDYGRSGSIAKISCQREFYIFAEQFAQNFKITLDSVKIEGQYDDYCCRIQLSQR